MVFESNLICTLGQPNPNAGTVQDPWATPSRQRSSRPSQAPTTRFPAERATGLGANAKLLSSAKTQRRADRRARRGSLLGRPDHTGSLLRGGGCVRLALLRGATRDLMEAATVRGPEPPKFSPDSTGAFSRLCGGWRIARLRWPPRAVGSTGVWPCIAAAR